MSSQKIKEYVELLKEDQGYDQEFLRVLEECSEKSEDTEITTSKIIQIIKRRYAESRENKT